MGLKLSKPKPEEAVVEEEVVIEETVEETVVEEQPKPRSKKAGKLKPAAYLKEFTAEAAKELLASNTNNRKKKLNWIKTLAQRILDGEWDWNGEAIILDEYGRIVSGQHRLEALILAQDIVNKGEGKKKTLKLLFTVSEGIGEEAADTVDAEIMTRKLKDVFYRHHEFGDNADKTTAAENEALAKTLAGALRLVWLRFNGKVVASGGRFSHRDALEFFKLHPDLKDAVRHVHAEDQGSNRFIRTKLVLPYAAALMYLSANADANVNEDGTIVKGGSTKMWEKAEEFVTLLASGANLDKTHAVYCLIHHYGKLNTNPPADKRDQICHYWAKCWNLFVNDEATSVKDTNVKKNEVPRMGGMDREIVEAPVEEAVPEPVEA